MKTALIRNMFPVVGVALIVLTAFAGPAQALQTRYREAIDLSAEQRTLTQMMSKEMLLIALGVDPDRNVGNLRRHRERFAEVLRALRNGDEQMDLPAHDDPKILAELARAEGVWPEFDEEVRQVLASGLVTRDQVAAFARTDTNLLGALDGVLAAYEEAAAHWGRNSVFTNSLHLIELQRELTQQMSKEFLLIAYGIDVPANRANLTRSIDDFDGYLRALIEGDPEHAVLAAPTPELQAQFADVAATWYSMIPVLNAIADGRTVDVETMRRVDGLSNDLLEEIDTALAIMESL
ncbi:MAG: hypothetical protein HKM95_17735 [Inquilinus sp.]|nr:hypothetical protein [Inquilinus sp.]